MAQRIQQRAVEKVKKNEKAEGGKGDPFRKEILFSKGEWGELTAQLPTGARPATWIHDEIMRIVREGSTPSTDEALGYYRVPILAKAPAGPWEEAVASASEFVVSGDVADELETREGDAFVRLVGQSLEGANLPDGSLLQMRPLPNNALPRDREIALVQVETEEGWMLSTVKRWRTGEPPVLLDGDDNEFSLPGVVKEMRPVAVMRGAIVRRSA